MANATKWARRIEEWTTSLPNDVQATWDLLAKESLGPAGRRWLAGALSYTLTRFDLIPDHERAGSVDDAFVLRIAYGLAAEHAGKAGKDDAGLIARMTHDEDELREFLGDTIYAKLRRYVMELPDKEVRGRTVEQILGDERARTDMKRELEIQCKKMKPTHVESAEDAEALVVSVQSYLKMKLSA
jgi:uncharacterized membrane protein YkvA (DUF1232 family)